MIVHIFADTPHHYVSMASYFRSLKDVPEEQLFWALTLPEQREIDGFDYYRDDKDLKRQLDRLPKDTKLIIHGNFDPRVWLMLLFHPLTSKASCVFWGADIYRYQLPKLTFKQQIIKWIHRLLCRRYKSVVCLNKGDARLVEKYLKRRDALVIPYPLEQTYLDNLMKTSECESSTFAKPLTFLVGNSAAQSNNHLEMFEQLKHLADENIKVVCTLNYAGKLDYIKQVIKVGSDIFGDKFIAYQDMLTKQEHAKLLSGVDICVFGHDRQQGLFVVYAMFALNKPVFMKSKVSSFSYLTDMGFKLTCSESLNSFSYESLRASLDNERGNSEILNNTLTETALAPNWRQLLEH